MGSSELIGIFATDVSSGVQGNLYTELHKKAMSEGCRLVLFSGTYDRDSYRITTKASPELFSLAENMDFAAYIIHAQAIGDLDMINQLIEMGRRRQIPVFVYDGEATGVDRTDGIISIDPDYEQGFAESVRHLIEHHHCRNIFMLAGMKNNKYSDDRIAMYRREMEAHGIAYSQEQIGYGDFWENPAMEAVEHFLDCGLPTPEAICCANDSMAIATVKVLTRRGYRVPEDILVTGFDGIEDAKYNYPCISTCEPRLDAVADFIFDTISGKENARSFSIPLKFYPKESCGCNVENLVETRLEIPKFVESMRMNSWQHHIVSNMQFQLIDSCVLEELIEYSKGALDIFRNYAHVFCVRDDIESRRDNRDAFDKMRVFLNKGFMESKTYQPFGVEEIVPDFDRVLENLGAEDMLIFRLVHNGDKQYGYHIARVGHYSSNEIRILGQFTESFTLVVESILRNMRLHLANQKLSEMYEKMSEIYIRDTMTGLYNRHGYYRRLEEYLKKEELAGGYIHVISIDMDGMKYINDSFGHLEGDYAIKAVAYAINECFAHPCISARFGGDEFMVAIFTESGTKPTNDKISWKLNNFLLNTDMLAGKDYKVGVSVGQAVVKISEIKNMKSVEKIADDCMYEEKRKRKSRSNQ